MRWSTAARHGKRLSNPSKQMARVGGQSNPSRPACMSGLSAYHIGYGLLIQLIKRVQGSLMPTARYSTAAAVQLTRTATSCAAPSSSCSAC
jgi:hypothetical protein